MNSPLSLPRRRLMIDALSGVGAAALLPLSAAIAADGRPPAAKPAPPSHAKAPTGDLRDFDFFVGKWESVNRRLKRRWVGSDDWDVFPNTVECRSHMGGVVNIDEVVFPTKGWAGMTVRTFSLEKKQWSLYWINSKTGELFPPVVGGFVGDEGEFYGDDTDEGKPIKVVFKWTRLAPGKARWQQAFSLDGKRWETNWVVDHTRVDA